MATDRRDFSADALTEGCVVSHGENRGGYGGGLGERLVAVKFGGDLGEGDASGFVFEEDIDGRRPLASGDGFGPSIGVGAGEVSP
jgi:hypothetical protein